MIARKIKPEEVKRTEELFSVSFDSSYNNEETSMELYRKYIDTPESREQEHCLERFAAFEDDDTTMMSCFIVQPFNIRFDGHKEKMNGIGGVATLPQYRKRGGIRSCFASALPYMYEQGAAFSYLYPFSTAYYRKFGYEICCKRHLYRIALPHIPAYPTSGTSYLLEETTKADAMKDIPYIYRKWLEKYNMMVEDTDYDYRFIETASPFKDQVFTYVYRSDKGEALGLMTFKCNTSPEHRLIECSRFFYINKEGLQGLLTLAKSYAADYRHIHFSLPADMPLEQVLPEWSMGAVSCDSIPNGMVRVINVKKVLEDAQYIGDGALSLEISDPFIPQNNGVFTVTFRNGTCEELAMGNGSPDIALPISAFSALIAGGYDTSTVPLWEGVSVYGDMKDISKVFYKKAVHIATYF